MCVIHQGIICCIWYLGVRACWVGPGLENQVKTCVNKSCFAPKQGQGVNGSYEVIHTKWCFSQMKPFEPIGTFLNHFPHLKPLSTILWSFEPVWPLWAILSISTFWNPWILFIGFIPFEPIRTILYAFEKLVAGF